MPNVVSEMLVREITDTLEGAEGMLWVSFGGLTVKESEGLRNELAEADVTLRMVRNKLARRALSAAGYELGDEMLSGNMAVAWGSPEQTIHAAKVLTKPEVKKAGKVTVRAGILEGRVLGPADANALAEVPDKDTLRAQMLGALSGPARGLVTVLAGPGSALARVIQAQADAGGFAGEGAAAAAPEASASVPDSPAPEPEAPADTPEPEPES